MRMRADKQSRRRVMRMSLLLLVVGAVLPSHVFAASPWEDAVQALTTAFTGPIARGLSLVAIVVGGLMFAFGEGDSKRMLAGIVFGVGMAIGAVNFMAWLFP
jgi:type IV secretory pathway VirB2 component (pilin)